MAVKYLVIVFATYTDDTKAVSSIYQYDTADEALQNFYKNMGKYVNTSNVATVTVEVKSSIGEIIKNDAWVLPIKPKPVPVEEV